MKKITVDLPGREYDISIQRGILREAGRHIRPLIEGNKLLAVTDSQVETLYAPVLLESLGEAGFEMALVTLPAGEQAKHLSQVERIWNEAAAFGLSRGDGLVALGGGVVGDVTGFAAATLYRGVDYVQVPTTLLAQVDSAIGGKTGINLAWGKNLAGAFWQPRAVLTDPDCLDTLDERTFADGMAEVIKYGCIADRELFESLLREKLPIEEILARCCAIKAALVSRDEGDRGSRMLLNFGHTLGHGYELAGNFSAVTHGQAVAAGMVAAARLGEALGITQAGTAEKIAGAVRAFGLPDRLSCDRAVLAKAVGLDKKGSGSAVKLVLLRSIGEAVTVEVEKDTVVMHNA